MELDNLNSRKYYIDQDIIIADSPRLGMPVLYLRKEGVSQNSITKAVKTCRMSVVSDGFETYEGFKFLRLEQVT